MNEYLEDIQEYEKEKYVKRLYYRVTPILFGFFVISWLIIKLSPEDVPTDFLPMDGMKGITLEFIIEFIVIYLLIRAFLKHRAKKNFQKELDKFKGFQAFMEEFESNHFPIRSAEVIFKNKRFLQTSTHQPKEYKAASTEQIRFLEGRLSELERKYSVEPFPFRSYDSKDVLDLYYNLRRKYPHYVEDAVQEMLEKHQVLLEWLYKRSEIKEQLERAKKQAQQSYQKHLGILQSGNRGEDRVEKELSQLSSLGSYLSNVRIKIDGSSVETDNIIFTPNGIFLIEVKNFSESGNYSLRITKDGQWQRVYKNGLVKPMEKDVTAQHNRHLILKEKFIQRKWKEKYGEDAPKITYHPIIVIANDNIMIENQTDLPILRTSQIYHHILKYHDDISQDILKKVKNILEENQLPLKIYAVPDWTEVLEKLERGIAVLNPFHEEMYDLLTKLNDEISKLNLDTFE